MAEEIGGVQVTISGNYEPLAADLQSAQQLAATSADNIARAFTSGASAAGDFESKLEALIKSGMTLSEAMGALATNAETAGKATGDAGAAAGTAAGEVDAAAKAFQNLLDAAGLAAAPLSEVGKETETAGGAAHHASGSFEEMARQLVEIAGLAGASEVIREVGSEAITAFSDVQQFSNSLTVLTGSATSTRDILASIREIEESQPFAFNELAEASRKLTLVGVAAGDIPGILDKISNTARGAGTDFGTVSTALERVGLTGQLQGRALMALGLTWSDLAKSMGTSIEDAQAKLKKGGQDALKDLDDVLGAMQDKFGKMAGMPMSIGEQFTLMRNQIHAAMQDLGESLAPVVSQIVSFLTHDLIPAVKTLLDSFNALPEPVKNGAVALGLVTVALVPLAAAIAAVGLAINTVQGAVPALATLMQGLGVTAATTATQVGTVETAVTAMSTGLGGGTVAAGGMLTAVGALGLGLATFGGAAAVTASNIVELKDKWDDTVNEFKRQQIADALNSGVTVEKLKQIGISEDQLKAAVQGANKEIDYGKLGLDGLAASAEHAGNKAAEAAPKFDDFGVHVHKIGDDAKVGSAAYDALSTSVDKSRAALETAQQALDYAKTHMDGSKESADNLAAAHVNLKSAQDNWNKTIGDTTSKLGDHIKTVGELITEEDQLQKNVGIAQGVFDKLYASVAAGKAPAEALAMAYEQLQKALKSAHEEAGKYSDVAGDYIKKADDQTARIKALMKAEDELTWSLADGEDATAALTLVTKDLEAALKSAGDKARSDYDPSLKKVDDTILVLTGHTHNVKDGTNEFGASISGTRQKVIDYTKSNDDLVAGHTQLGKSIAVLNDGVFPVLKGYMHDIGKGAHDASTELSNMGTVATTSFRQSLVGGQQFADSLVYVGSAVTSLGSIFAQQIGTMEAQWDAFAKGVGSFSPNLGLGPTTGTGGSKSGAGAGLPGGGAVAKGDLSQEPYDLLFEDYQRNLGLQFSPGARILAQAEYQELQRRWAKGEGGISGATTGGSSPAAGGSGGSAKGTGGGTTGVVAPYSPGADTGIRTDVGFKSGSSGIPVLDALTGGFDQIGTAAGAATGPMGDAASSILQVAGAAQVLAGTVAGTVAALAGAAGLPAELLNAKAGTGTAAGGMAPVFSGPLVGTPGGTAGPAGTGATAGFGAMPAPTGGGGLSAAQTKPAGWTDAQWSAFQSGGSDALLKLTLAPSGALSPAQLQAQQAAANYQDTSKMVWGTIPSLPTVPTMGISNMPSVSAGAGIKSAGAVYVTINNPTVLNQSMADQLVTQIQNLGVVA